MDVNPDICTISHIQNSTGLLPPYLVNFEYGHLTKEDTLKLECEMFVDSNNPRNKSFSLCNKSQKFSAKLGSSANQLCRTFLLIRNKKKNEGRVLPIETCIFTPVVKKQKLSLTNQSSGIERYSDLNKLSQAFGSKKLKRATDLNIKMNVGASLKEDDIKETVSAIDVKASDLEVLDSDETILQLLPPCNREAKEVSQVYLIEDIISDSELQTALAAAQHLIENPPTDDEKRSSHFIYSIFYELGSDPPLNKVQLLMYANSLLTFINMTVSELKVKTSSKIICPFSYTLANKILKAFTVSMRTRPPALKDKAVCCLMVIVLLICEYKINLDILSSCLKGFSYKKLVQLCRIVGAVPLSGSSIKNNIYLLKLPLPSLPSSHKHRKGIK